MFCGISVCAATQRLGDDLSTAEDQRIVGMNRDAAHTASFRHNHAHFSILSQCPHAAVDDVAKQQAPSRIPNRAFD